MKRVDPELCVRLAREHGTPFYLYDAAVIRARIAELRGFDVIRYAQKACSNVHLLRLMRAEGVLVDAVSNGEIGGRARGRGLHGGPDRRGDARSRDRPRHSRERGLDGHAGAGGPTQARSSGLAARESGLRAWSQPQDEHRRTLEQARNLARVSRRGAARGGEAPARSGRPAHAHRIRGGLRTSRPRLRRHGRQGEGAPDRRARSLAAAGCRFRTKPTRRASTRPRCTGSGTRRGARSRRASVTASRSRSSRAGSWSPRRGCWSRRSARRSGSGRLASSSSTLASTI